MNDPPPTTREQFTGRISRALGKAYAPGHVPHPPAVDDELARVCGDDGDLVSRFAERAAAVGVDVRRCTAGELCEALVDVVDELGIGSALLNTERLRQHRVLGDLLRGHGVELHEWRGDRAMAAGFAADAGITDAAGAIAESGSLVLATDGDHGRAGALAPPVHVAIVPASGVVADLLDWARALDADGGCAPPACRQLVTGPSKTADIEGVLVTGVHGPGRVVVLLIEDQ